MDALAPLLQKSSDGRCLSVLSGGVHGPYAGYGEELRVETWFRVQGLGVFQVPSMHPKP